MKRKLLDILACPIDKYHPLELHVFEETDEIVEGLMLCPKCLRWFPIRDEIPEMLPDELREKKEDVSFIGYVFHHESYLVTVSCKHNTGTSTRVKDSDAVAVHIYFHIIGIGSCSFKPHFLGRAFKTGRAGC